MFIADLAEVMKGIRALAPNSPDIAVAIDSNQSLVDNYVKVSLQIQHGNSAKSIQCQLLLLFVLSVMHYTACGQIKKHAKLPLLRLAESAGYGCTHVDGEYKYNMHLLKPGTVQAMMQKFETQSA